MPLTMRSNPVDGSIDLQEMELNILVEVERIRLSKRLDVIFSSVDLLDLKSHYHHHFHMMVVVAVRGCGRPYPGTGAPEGAPRTAAII
ncbi:hypothetical protein QZH45_11095 [Pseudomonas corrugata]|uniref:hypothetical protein n=1 Tax=Pseudomonas corrugata TaxID=47879 RepID=UPI0006D8D35E|nr:hypothetical protein [Pseudomonas corrugata]AOE64879.1 hypothetical protein AXG94_24915 [Pseudomonas corrugata]